MDRVYGSKHRPSENAFIAVRVEPTLRDPDVDLLKVGMDFLYPYTLKKEGRIEPQNPFQCLWR